MDRRDLVEHYPVLLHMAEPDSWSSIEQIGLRTTAQLVEACSLSSRDRDALLLQRRPFSVAMEHPLVGAVTIRDQKPLALHNLRLTDVTLEGFLHLLNTRVFLWTSPHRLLRLLSARPYRRAVHDVLVMDTASVLSSCGARVRLTGMNTGATIFPSAPPRGAESFYRVEDFPFFERSRMRKRLEDNVVEFCVIDGIDNVADHLIRIERRQGADVLDYLYER